MNWTNLTIVISLALSSTVLGCAPASAESRKAPGTISLTPKPDPQGHSSALAYQHYLRSRLYLNEGRLRQAVDEMKHALLYDHSSAHLHVALGDLYARQGLWKKAEKQASMAVDIDGNDVEALVLKGQAAIHAGHYDKAVAYFEKVSTLDPKNILAYASLVTIYLSQKDKAKAVATLKKMVASNPGSSEGFKKLGDLFFEQGDEKTAEKYYRRVLQLSPSDAQTTQTLAGILEQQGRYKEAIKVLGEALASSPENPNIMAFMARLYLKDGDEKAASAYITQLRSSNPSNASLIARAYAEINHHEEAIAELQKVLKEYPNAHNERLLLAILFEEIKKWDQAIDNLAMIPPSSSLYPLAQNSIGYCLIRKDQPNKAMTVLQKAIEVSDTPDIIGRIYMNIAAASSKLKKFKEGLAQLDLAISKYPDLTDLYVAKANLLFESGRGAKGVEVLKSILKRFPTDVNTLYALGALYERMEKTDESIKSMRRLLEVDPNNSAALNFIGYTMADQGKDLDEAERLIRRALRLDPGSGAITDSLGWLLYKRKKYKQALEYLRRADRITPGEPVIIMHVGDAYKKLGERTKAIEYYRRALESKPEKKDREEIIKRLEKVGISSGR